MTEQLSFEQAGRLPAATDNVAIAGRRLEAGTQVIMPGGEGSGSLEISHTVLEGHRFAIQPIAAGEVLLSWGLPFGEAIQDIAPGDYLCNDRILWVLQERHVDFDFPAGPNFKDRLAKYGLDEAAFLPGTQVPLITTDTPETFLGFERPGGRGVGTRNHVVILAVNSTANSYSRLLAEKMQDSTTAYPNIDGVVAVTHTEGSGEAPNNLDFILRALAGFVVHPNVGAVLVVDSPGEPVSHQKLSGYLTEKGYPLSSVLHGFLTLDSSLDENLAQGQKALNAWLPQVNQFQRQPFPLSKLMIALQCGGSDAFSGISGNPLAGWVAREVIRRGGSANLAETDELIGAEHYVLENVRDLETARAFLNKVEIFRERAGWHGQSVEGNPSGGNNYRGLYNITLKSIGAARKKPPEVRLDYVIDYGQPMTEPGYYFMDSPGNDLESIAGQVASGANMILFITGNGSITNFPFVPTVKIMTTSSRFELLHKDMDINAGRYQDGTPMDELGEETLAYTRRIASGEKSIGERAGHHQVSLWRHWRQTGATDVDAIKNAPTPSGIPLQTSAMATSQPSDPLQYQAFPTTSGFATERVGLVIPSSLCSAEISRLAAKQLNGLLEANPNLSGISRVVALPHTEGCGAAGGDSEQLYLRTVLGHLNHPMTACALVLEHGCEKTVNDYIRNYMEKAGMEVEKVGWISVQMDGGIDQALANAKAWFEGNAPKHNSDRTPTDLAYLRVGLTTSGPVTPIQAMACAAYTHKLISTGATVVIPSQSELLKETIFTETLGLPVKPGASLAFGQPVSQPGLHIMDTPTRHSVEILSGLGGTGVEIMVAHVTGIPLQSHPLIPLIQVSSDLETRGRYEQDLDAVAPAQAAEVLEEEMVRLTLATASGEYQPKLFAAGHTDFQITRGLLGISM